MTKRDYQAAEYAAECGPINTQARIADGCFGAWTSYGIMGFIEAAKKHAEGCGLSSGSIVQVRDANDPARPVAMFAMRRVVSYEVIDPRQGE